MCDERERLIGYVYDECEPAERRALETHLDDCGICRAEIGGLRSVRQDLLAWDVPPHEAVWRPLVSAPVTPWYRQVPAWAMAAAAGVMFLVGAAGGVVTHALVPHERAAATTTAAAPVQMTPAVVTVGQLSEVEQRMVQMMRDELGKRELAARAVPAVIQPTSGPGLTPVRLNEMIGASEQRQWEMMRDVQNDFFKQISSLRREVSAVKEVVLMQQSGGGR